MRFYELSKITNIDLSFDHSVVADDMDIGVEVDGDRIEVDGVIIIDLLVDEKHVDVIDDDERDSFDIWIVDMSIGNFKGHLVTMPLSKREVEVETEMMPIIHIDVDDEVDDSDIGVDENEVNETQMMPEADEIPFMEKVENDDIWNDGMNIHDHEVMVEILIIEIDEIEVEEILIITEKIQVDDDDLYGETEVSDEQ